MHVIGEFVSNFANLYQEINPSKLSGAIDVIVIQQPDGTCKSSPFYVKFGVLDIVRAENQKVELYVNDQLVDIEMELSKSGHAYFVNSAGPCNCQSCRIPVDTIDIPSTSASLRSPDSKSLTLKDIDNKNPFLSDSELLSKSHDALNDFANSDHELQYDAGTNPSEYPEHEEFSLLPHSALPDFHVELSLCGKLQSSSKKPDKFDEHIVTFTDFINNPDVLHNTNLVVQINDHFYNWPIAGSIIVSYVAFNCFLPSETLLKLKRKHFPKKSHGWFYWVRSTEPDISEEEPKQDINKSRIISMQPIDSDDQLDSPSKSDCTPINTELIPHEQHSPLIVYQHCQRKPTTLSFDLIQKLNLSPGENNVTFSITTRYQGTVNIKAKIFLWSYMDKIVISDVDGTITRSDILGIMLPILGKDWTHGGVSKLFTLIHNNGYKIVYLSARTIGISNQTRRYLENIIRDTHKLPSGPILLSPSSLIEALHREVILKKPEIFKIDCLQNIINLFPPNTHPLISGFGNRINDYRAYLTVGIPQSKIFIINAKGQIRQKWATSYLPSYSSMAEFVDLIFPLVDHQRACNFHLIEYNDFFYWKKNHQSHSGDTMKGSFSL